MSDNDPANTIAFQGHAGAYSHLASRDVYPGMTVLPQPDFEAAFEAVATGKAALAMIPIENSLAGRVADIHHLLPESGLFLVAEHFQRVNHHLMGIEGATLKGLKTVHSHVHALGQCRDHIRALGLTPSVQADTAGSARDVAAAGDPTQAAIASSIAAEIYGLKILKPDFEDADHNTTRFVVLARESKRPPAGAGPAMTSIVFRVRNVPAALYKAMGGFATNGINMVKLESYQLGGTFNATQFFADIEGHPDEVGVKFAFEELEFYTNYFRVLGTYPAHPFRGLT
ncbi:MAG TPA: prephenate dehydratase [Alphaproteobacteria bacterium]|jgi:prephenate dehydratase|nr:prephenate dehydratase [Alphaproteobacteria bacterium]